MLPHLQSASPPSCTPVSSGGEQKPSPPTPTPSRAAEVWGIDFSVPKTKRKTNKKEREALLDAHYRRLARTAGGGGGDGDHAACEATSPSHVRDSEGNVVHMTGSCTASASAQGGAAMKVVRVDGLADRDALIPRHLTTTRADLEARFVLRQPRLLCVNKQYPRSCGISSLTSIYNYLYSRIGESEVGQSRAPVSQEEVMSVLGFEPPFGEIHWGPFTGNGTLIRWFHALNHHFGLSGSASILYKAHGKDKTTHLYNSTEDVLTAVKAALRDPHCALIYHCYNHYMVPVGYQDIPIAQTDFFEPTVPLSNCETTVFIGEVSRGRHEAMYARRWAEIVQDIECASPFFVNIRHPELGVQRKETGKVKKASANTNTNAATADTGNTASKDEESAKDTVTVTATDTNVLNVAPPAKARGKAAVREPNNLHCLILFRNDVVATDRDQYLHPSSSDSECDLDGNDTLAASEAAENKSKHDTPDSSSSCSSESDV